MILVFSIFFAALVYCFLDWIGIKDVSIIFLLMLFSVPFSWILWMLPGSIKKGREHKKRETARELASGAITVNPEEFNLLRQHFDLKVEGVYLLLNLTKGIYYVGQSKDVFRRVNTHFSGRGNGDVYADFKYGNEFSIKIIPLEDSGFNNIDELERYMISAHEAYTHGYNKNRGKG